MRNKVTAIIPTYNGKKLLQKHLESVLAALRNHDEVLIVDDASSDDTVSWLQKHYSLEEQELKLPNNLSSQYWPQLSATPHLLYRGATVTQRKRVTVTVLALQRNCRFGAAVNAAVAYAQHELVLLLNNDVEPSPDVLSSLIPHFSDTSVFAVGCKEYQDATKQHASGKNKLWFAEGLYQHSGVSLEELTFGDTAWVSGGSGLFSRSKWLQIGGFDPQFYPAYWEDVDISFRARSLGWKVLFDPTAIVFHQHESTNSDAFGRDRIQKMSWKHADTFSWKHASVKQKVLFLMWHPVWVVRRWLV